MSEYCEVAEGVALATSSCPATDVVVYITSSAASTSSVDGSGPQPQGVLVSTAAATSEATPEAYAVLTSSADVLGTVVTAMDVTATLVATGRAVSSVVQVLADTVVSTADATSTCTTDSPQLLESTASVISTAEGNTTSTVTTIDGAASASSVVLGLLENVTSSAAAVSTVTLLRLVSSSIDDAVAATSTATGSSMVQEVAPTSYAYAVSTVDMQAVASTLAVSAADAVSSVWFKNPAAKAWVMNTETTAASWYDNFEFESIAQVNGRTLAVGPDGVYELTGDNDAGAQIRAEVVSGFVDFGSAQTKRLDSMYFGYTSSGRLSVTAETYESGHAPTTYFLEQRDADAPRNSRVTPGKGLFGRYWRTTIKNVDGVDFEVRDTSVDIATSTRRL